MTRGRSNTPKTAPTYEGEVLSVLVYEFFTSVREESDRKIRRRLQRKKLGKFDAERIADARALKDELLEELSRGAAS